MGNRHGLTRFTQAPRLALNQNPLQQRFYAVDPVSQQENTPKYRPFKELITASEFMQTVKSQKLGQAVEKYEMLRDMKKIDQLTYSDLHDYLVLLCKHRPSSDFAVPQSQLTVLVETVLCDIENGKYEIHPHLFPVLLRFFVTVGQYKKAIKLFDQMTSRNLPKSAESLVSMLICYQKLGEFDKAEEIFAIAKQECGHLNYGRFLAERTLIRVYGQQGKLNEAHRLRDDILSRPEFSQDKSNAKLVRLAFLDACAESRNINAFMLAADEFKRNTDLDNEGYNHILINLSKLGLYDEVVKNLEQHNASFAPIPSEFRPRTANHAAEYFQSILQFKERPLAPSTFSDILFNIVKDTQEDSPKKAHLVGCAEAVFGIYEEQILDSFDKLRNIAREMKFKSQLAIMQGVQETGNVHELPYRRIYSVFVRSSNPFIAMAKVYVNAGRNDDALTVLRRGYEYQAYNVRQLKHVFGATEDVENIPELKALTVMKKDISQATENFVDELNHH